ncbi:E3 ubiquitin-protein ligase TRIM21-like isoform 2-T2 [Menidia menidia]
MAGTLDELQFRCTVCLDVFSDPVSTPCGHNFCKLCLGTYWDTTEVCRCPLCKEMFLKRPELRVNMAFREVVDHFKSTVSGPEAGREAREADPGEVACDICADVKAKASRSCLVCMASYCEAHLEPHKTATALSKHKLIKPVKNLEERICHKHERILELYCKKEEEFICQTCAETDHSRHQVVTTEVASQQKMIQVKRREREVELMIQDRHRRIEGMMELKKKTKENAEKQMQDSIKVFTSVIDSIKSTHEALMEQIEVRFNAEQERLERLIGELREELEALEKKSVELQQLSQIEDQITLLQTINKANALPPTQNWATIPAYEVDFLGYMRASLIKAKEFINLEIRRQESTELGKMKTFADDLTIDPNSAGSWLAVSEDGKEVRQSVKRYKLLLGSGENTFAAATQALTTGRHYWEVEVKGKSNWALGVVSDVLRRETLVPCPEIGMWTISHSEGSRYVAAAQKPTHLRVGPPPRRVGVFVDYEEGQVSFFNVEAKSHIFTFAGCSFTKRLRPVFDPCLAPEKKETLPLKLMMVEIAK